MIVTYDREADVLYLHTGRKIDETTSFSEGPQGAVDLATKGGREVIGFEILAASMYFDCYDAGKDVWTLGETTDDPELMTVTGDFVAYWALDEFDPDDTMDFIGITVLHAGKYLDPIRAGIAKGTKWIKMRV